MCDILEGLVRELGAEVTPEEGIEGKNQRCESCGDDKWDRSENLGNNKEGNLSRHAV